MNIFATSECPVESAYNLPHCHVVKMITETCQLLSTAHIILDNSTDERLCKLTHKNHPSSVWTRACNDNYMWLLEHLKALGDVYSLRHDKVHGAIEKRLQDLLEPPRAIPESTFVYQGLPTPSMPDKFKQMNEPTEVKYQLYLNWKYLEWIKEGNKACKGLVWCVDYPEWLDKSIVEYSEKLRG